MTSIKVYFFDSSSDNSIDALCAEYCKRVRWNIEFIKLKSRSHDSAAQNIAWEEKEIEKVLGKQDYIVLLDPMGKKLNSITFSKYIVDLMESTKHIKFFIGGSDGISENIKQKAQAMLSFSDMTFPHKIAKLLLSEQIYRAYTIHKNIKYHK